MADPIKSDFEKLENEIKWRHMDRRKAETLVKKSVKWFVDKARYAVGKDHTGKHKVTPDDLMKGKQGIRGAPIVGQLFVYNYDPKLKETLPYYDTFPLVMPIAIYEDGWLGINFHYLPPYVRARLLGLLRATMRSEKLSREVKARITYGIIKTMARFKIATPAIKRYLSSHVTSKVVRIHPQDWQQVIFLPVESFVKAPKEQVWRDSLAMMRKI